MREYNNMTRYAYVSGSFQHLFIEILLMTLNNKSTFPQTNTNLCIAHSTTFLN